MAMVTKTLNEILAQSPSPERLKQIANIKDENIDFSDIPELTKDDFAKAMPFAEFQEKRRLEKNQTSAFDADIVQWLSMQNIETKQHVNEAVRHIMLAFPH
jgi:myo-inositol-1-phosphate synthase